MSQAHKLEERAGATGHPWYGLARRSSYSAGWKKSKGSCDCFSSIMATGIAPATGTSAAESTPAA